MNALVVQHQVSDLERMAHAFAASRLFGVQNPEQALALCLIAQAEGRHPATAAQDYSIINNRPAKKAEAMLRDFLSAGGKVQWHELSDTRAEATFSHAAGGTARIEWTPKRAEQAGVYGQMYKKYPRQMLRSRCVSEGVRTIFPMATSGMYVPEEAAEIPPDDRQPSVAQAADFPGDPSSPGPATQQALEDQSRPRTAPNGVKRLSSAQAKERGLHLKIDALIDACETEDDLAAFDREFERHTAECPLSWLDAIRNRAILRREEIVGRAKTAEYEAEFDQAFVGAVGPKEAAPA